MNNVRVIYICKGKIFTSYGKNFDRGPHFHVCTTLTFATVTYRPTSLHLLEETVNVLSRQKQFP